LELYVVDKATNACLCVSVFDFCNIFLFLSSYGLFCLIKKINNDDDDDDDDHSNIVDSAGCRTGALDRH